MRPLVQGHGPPWFPIPLALLMTTSDTTHPNHSPPPYGSRKKRLQQLPGSETAG